MISFTTSREDTLKIKAVVERAERIAHKHGFGFDKLSVHMDISACVANGTPLDFEELLAAKESDFVHDVWGISQHIDRDDRSPTGGKLLRCFVPRYAKRETVTN